MPEEKKLSFKEKMLKFKDKAVEFKDKTIEASAKHLANSSFTISTKQQLESIIKASATTKFKSKETGKTKTFKHKVFVIFADESSDFFEKALVIFPVILTKAFSQNIKVKLAKSKIVGINLKKDYNINSLPSLLVFEEEKVFKIIEGEENILKLVKNLNLDINKVVEKL